MARILVFACEDMHGMKTQPDHPLRVWAIEYAGQLLSRAQKSTRDGRTAWELRKGGRSYNRELPAFGEAIIFLKVPRRMMKLPKFEDRWDTGVYVGLVEGTNEIRVLTPKGALRVNSVKRLPQAQRRDPELVKVVVGLPWEPVPSGAPRPKRVGVSFVPVVPEEEAPERVQPRREEVAPRQYYIRRKVELVLYGYTEGCPGCDAA